MTHQPYRLALSVDMDEWYHSRRWVDMEQARTVPDTKSLFQKLYGSDRPAGEIIAPTHTLLDLFDRYAIKVTFFILGEVAEWYPDLVKEIADRGHEIGCHGMHHVDMTLLGPDIFAQQLEQALEILEQITGQRPIGYRAPNLVYESWATRILEDRGFVYDTTVCPARPVTGKYVDWLNSPMHPYHPSYEAIGQPGEAKLVEVPIPSFPVIKLPAGSGIWMRVIGYHWTLIGLINAIRTGDTSFYFHPWELGKKPTPDSNALKNAIFLRHTGPWMLERIERIIKRFHTQIVPVHEVAARG